MDINKVKGDSVYTTGSFSFMQYLFKKEG